MFTVFFADVVFFVLVLRLGICVEVYVDRITILPLPPPDFSSLPTILSLKQVTVIWNQRAPKAGFGAVKQFSFILVTLRNVSQRASCEALRWDKVITIRRVCIVPYRIIFSFHLAKRINHPDPGWDRKVRYCSLF